MPCQKVSFVIWLRIDWRGLCTVITDPESFITLKVYLISYCHRDTQLIDLGLEMCLCVNKKKMQSGIQGINLQSFSTSRVQKDAIEHLAKGALKHQAKKTMMIVSGICIPPLSPCEKMPKTCFEIIPTK